MYQMYKLLTHGVLGTWLKHFAGKGTFGNWETFIVSGKTVVDLQL